LLTILEFMSLYDGGLNVSSQNLQRYMPTVLKCIHKNTNFDEKLRDISQITGGLWETASDMIYHIVEHFHRPSLVLDMERYDLTHLNTSQNLGSMLFIGKSFVQDFNMESDHNLIQLYQHWSPISSAISPRQKTNENMNNEKYSIYRNGFKGSGCYISGIFDTSGTDLHQSIAKWKVQRSNSHPKQEIPSSNPLLTSMLSDLKSTPVDPVPGRGIMGLRQLSFAKEIAYTLLTGRLLVIHGNNEAQVKNFIGTCSLFVPGLLTSYQETEESNKVQICSWRIKPLTVVDLAKFKLIGMSKKAAIPKSLEGLISRYDIDEQVLITNVQYKGHLLSQIFDREKRWPDESTFLAYIHSVFADMGTKAALLYHQHHLYNIKNQNSKFKHSTPARVLTEKTLPTPTPIKSDELHVPHAPTPQQSPINPHIGMGVQFTIPPRRTGSNGVPPVIPLSPQSTGRRVERKKKLPALKRKAPAYLNFLHSNNFSGSFLYSASAHDLEAMRDCMKPNLRQLGVRGHDANIIEYLADVVKQQQYKEQNGAPLQLILDNNVNIPLVVLKSNNTTTGR
jgi:hypothetical protein